MEVGYGPCAAYDSFVGIERIAPRPFLLVAGLNANTMEHSRIAFSKASEPKKLYTVEGQHTLIFMTAGSATLLPR